MCSRFKSSFSLAGVIWSNTIQAQEDRGFTEVVTMSVLLVSHKHSHKTKLETISLTLFISLG